MSDDQESSAAAAAPALNPADDPELDIGSKQFNPLKALQAKQIHVSGNNLRTYDNLAQFEPIFKRIFLGESNNQQEQRSTTSKKHITLSEGQVLPRRFTAAQQAIPTKPKSNRRTRNILLRMADAKTVGPLGQLQKWREERSLVKIYTRNEKEVDGHVIGYIEAFDKHWNVIISNAEQTMKRRKKRYSFCAVQPTDDCDEDVATAECIERLAALNITIPTLKVVGDFRRSVDCTRTVPQLMIRGEQIVSIATIDTKKT